MCNPRDDLDSLVDLFNIELSKVLDKHAPIVIKWIHPKVYQPWFDDEAMDSKLCRRQAERKLQCSEQDQDLRIFKSLKKSHNILVDCKDKSLQLNY